MVTVGLADGHLQLCLNTKGSFMVRINSSAICGQQLFEANVGMVNAVLSHGLGSDTAFLHSEYIRVDDHLTAFLLERRIGSDPIGDH